MFPASIAKVVDIGLELARPVEQIITRLTENLTLRDLEAL
jgi:hypothetical protein